MSGASENADQNQQSEQYLSIEEVEKVIQLDDEDNIMPEDEDDEDFDEGDYEYDEEDDQLNGDDFVVEHDGTFEGEQRPPAPAPELADSQCMFLHDDSVYSAACTSTFAVSGDGDDSAFIWDIKNGATLHTLSGHTDSVTSVDINWDATEVLTGAMDGCVKIWNVADGTCKYTLNDCSGDIEFAKFHPSGPAFVIGDNEGLLWLYSSHSGQLMHTMSGHEGAVSVGTWSHDGKMIYTGDESGNAIAWMAKTGQPAFKFPKSHAEPITAICSAPSQRMALSGAEDGSIVLMNLDNGRTMHKVQEAHGASVEAMCFANADSKLVATGGIDHQMHIWDLTTGQRRLSAQHDEAVVALICHTTLPVVYTGCADGNVRAWDMRSGDCIWTRHGHAAPIFTMNINKEQTVIITGSEDSTCRIIDCRVEV